MESVTKTIQQRYIENYDAACCPACKSEDLKPSAHQSYDDAFIQPITCGSCGVEWDDVYKLVSIDSESFDVSEMVSVEVPEGSQDSGKSPLTVDPSDHPLLQALLIRALSDAEHDNESEEVALCKRLLADIGEVA